MGLCVEANTLAASKTYFIDMIHRRRFDEPQNASIFSSFTSEKYCDNFKHNKFNQVDRGWPLSTVIIFYAVLSLASLNTNEFGEDGTERQQTESLSSIQ